MFEDLHPNFIAKYKEFVEENH